MNKENQIRIISSQPLNTVSIVKDIKPKPEKLFPCFLCSKSFSQKHSLARHLRTHKSNDGHQCFNCDKRFAAIRDLRKHIDIVHLNKAEAYKKECPICHARVQQLKTHIRFIHRNEGKSSEYNCVCPQCDKTFSNDYKVKRHIETVHEGVKNWQCTMCPKRFYEKKDLGRHVKGVHMGQKVDTWRSRKTTSRKASTKGQVVVTKSFFSTVPPSGFSTVDVCNTKAQITLPVNVLDEEYEAEDDNDDEEEDENDDVTLPSDVKKENMKHENIKVDVDRNETVNNPSFLDLNNSVDDSSDDNDDENVEMEIAEVDPVFTAEVDCRFQVCQQTVDDEGNLVLEIEEKENGHQHQKTLINQKSTSEKNKMVTLRWGEQSNVNDSKLIKTQSPSKTNNPHSKVIDLNLKLEDIIEDTAAMPSDDFVLPEVVGDLPDWFLNTSSVLDLPKDNSLSEHQAPTKENIEASPTKELDDVSKTAFRCGACAKMFITLEFLKSHIEKSHVGQKNLEVIETRKLSTQVTNTTNESPARNLKDEIICTIDSCDKKFVGKTKKLQYKRHVERVHLSVKKEECPKCDLKFYEKRDLIRHVDAIHLGLRTICPEAGCARPVVRLDQHMKLVHGDKDKAGNGKNNKACTCPECGATFSRVYDMTRHRENVHRGNKNFACDKCERKFADKRDLKRHYDAVHLNIKQKKSFDCSICQKSFKFKKLLDVHRLREHEGEHLPKPKESQEAVITAESRTEAANTQGATLANDDEEELNTVEIDGQLFIVQQTDGGLSLVPIVKSGDGSMTYSVSMDADSS